MESRATDGVEAHLAVPDSGRDPSGEDTVQVGGSANVENIPREPMVVRIRPENAGDGEIGGAKMPKPVIEVNAEEPGYASIIVTSRENILNDVITPNSVALQTTDMGVFDPDIDLLSHPNDVTSTQDTEIDSGTSQGVNVTKNGGKGREKGTKDTRVYPGDTDAPYKGGKHPNDVTYTDETEVDSGKAVDLPTDMGVVDAEKPAKK